MFRILRKCILASSIIVIFSGIQCFAALYWDKSSGIDGSSPYNNPYINDKNDKNNRSDLSELVDIKGDNSIINRLLGVFWLDNIEWDHKFISYVRWILNIALSLLSMIALIMTIYTFYMMFFTENEAWAKKAKWNLIGIFIALAIIGLAWLIVSFIFRWYQTNWKARESNLGTHNITMVSSGLYNQFYLTA